MELPERHTVIRPKLIEFSVENIKKAAPLDGFRKFCQERGINPKKIRRHDVVAMGLGDLAYYGIHLAIDIIAAESAADPLNSDDPEVLLAEREQLLDSLAFLDSRLAELRSEDLPSRPGDLEVLNRLF